MTASAFTVIRDPLSRAPTRDHVNAAVVWANSSADAIALIKALYSGDVDASWTNATVAAMAAGADLAGWSLHVRIINAANVVKADVTVIGAAAATIDSIAALAVTALNGVAGVIANAAYNSSTNVLTAAGAADALGDGRLIIEFYPPLGTVGQKMSVPGFIGTITHQGVNGAALTVAFAADSYTVPAVAAKFQSRDHY